MKRIVTVTFMTFLLFTGSTSTHKVTNVISPIEKETSETIVEISDDVKSETVVFKLHGKPKLKIKITNR